MDVRRLRNRAGVRMVYDVPAACSSPLLTREGRDLSVRRDAEGKICMSRESRFSHLPRTTL
jgi:hypothetical protein